MSISFMKVAPSWTILYLSKAPAALTTDYPLYGSRGHPWTFVVVTTPPHLHMYLWCTLAVPYDPNNKPCNIHPLLFVGYGKRHKAFQKIVNLAHERIYLLTLKSKYGGEAHIGLQYLMCMIILQLYSDGQAISTRLCKQITTTTSLLLRTVKAWTPDIGLSACISQLHDHESHWTWATPYTLYRSCRV